MKLKYPAEAFALGIVLFSRNMKEAFAGGILVLLAVVFAEFLKNLLENWIPVWSLRLCVLMGTGAVTASAFLLGFTALGITVDTSVRFSAMMACARSWARCRAVWMGSPSWKV